MTVKNRAQLTADKNAAFPSNLVKAITALILRGQQQDIIDSVLLSLNPTPQISSSDFVFNGNFSAPFIAEKYTLVLSATSVASAQQPAAVDTPLQIEFGPAQFTNSDPVKISALGAITFNQSGKYFIELSFQYGRNSGAGGDNVHIVTSFLYNAAYVAAISQGGLTDLDTQISFSSSSFMYPTAGDVMTFNILRDSSGQNSGGLLLFNPVLAGVPNVPTASIKIYRYQ